MSVTVTEIRTSSLRVTPLRLAVAPSAAGGDHGELSGLGDDDHPQYLTAARGDGRYAPLSHVHALDSLPPMGIDSGQFAQFSLFDPTAGDASAGRFAFCASSHPWTNGPIGTPNYTDHVASWGWNIKAPTQQDITGVPGFCNSLESRYYNGDGAGRSSFQFEWQLRGIRADGSQFRPLEIDCPHDGIGNSASFRVAQMFVGTETTGWDLTSTKAFEVKPLNGTAGGENGVAHVTPPAAHVNGARAFSVQFPAATNKTQTVFYGVANTNWGATAQIVNQQSGGSAAFELIAPGAGYSYVHFLNSSTPQSWSIGRDTQDHFAIATNAVPAGTPQTALRIDRTSRQVTFYYAPKLPSFAVSALPSAATYGAGSMIYVSNESGGAVVAFSDGASWRRMTDRAVVS